MKINDLRIGNWVKVNDPIFGVNTYKVATIRDNGIITLSDNISCSIDNIEPIELTEEVLTKIGFKKVREKEIASFNVNEFILKNDINDNEFVNISYQLFESGDSIIFMEQGDYYSGIDNNSIYKLNINYLHELQNIYYCLTNEELNIEL